MDGNCEGQRAAAAADHGGGPGQPIELDIKDAADRELLNQLLDQADVFVQNLVPGAVQRL
ncbi:MAG: hypothetical protein GEV08_14625, partial [Acidimicrobiia bacterium]|nr:hypothetical protein [Acidimicrobiia bacterium]